MGLSSSKPEADERWTFDLEHEKKHAQWAWDTNQESLAYCLDGFIAEHEHLTRERDELRASVEALLVLNQDLRAEVEFWKKRTEIEGEATMNAVTAAEELRAAVERLQRENGALARTHALAEEKLRERTEALAEMLESFTEPEDDNDILRRARAALER
jgi:hypothetical protein